MRNILLLAMIVSIIPLSVSAQSFSEDQEYWEQMSPSETEFTPAPAINSDEEVGEIERQEDALFPEGEENWNLGSEELPADEFE